MYPLTLNVDYPGGGRNRLTALFRLILAIPIIIVVTALATAIQLIVVPALLMILFRGKYPRWWFDFNVEWLRFDARINAYLLLLRDEYPSTDEEQAVHLNLERPERLNNFMPLIKWLLALPHYVALVVLGAIGVVVTVIAWLAILFTGKYPQGMFDFVVGVARWSLRVQAYMLILATDEYPPFRLGE